MKTAKDLIAKSWKETGVQKPRRGEVGSYAAHSIVLNNELTSIAFQNHLELYDEFVAWLVDLSFVLLSEEMTFKKEDNAYVHLVTALCSLALSVRHLMCSGHDVSAKILARSLAEYSDVLALLIVQPELCAEFQNEEKPEDFWKKHLQRGSARKLIRAALTLEGKAAEWWEQYNAFRAEEGKFLSASVHGSYVSAAMTTLAVDDRKVIWPGFLGRVTDASARTMVYIMECFSLIVFLSRFPFENERSASVVGVTFDRKKKLHRRVEARRYVLIRILKFLGTQQSNKGAFKLDQPHEIKRWARENLRKRLLEPT